MFVLIFKSVLPVLELEFYPGPEGLPLLLGWIRNLLGALTDWGLNTVHKNEHASFNV
jgi:hypothetical protein